MDALLRYIPSINIEEEIEPAINVIQRKQEHNSDLIDINEMGLGELTLQKKVRRKNWIHFIMVRIVSYNMNIYRRMSY